MQVSRPAPTAPRRSPNPLERQRDAERSRQRLLAAALDEFSAKGFAGARVQDIAARAGVNAQLITYYFGGKEGLYRALQQEWLDTEATIADPGLSIEDLLAAYAEHTFADPRPARLLLWAGLGDDAPAHDGEASAANAEADIAALHRRQERGEVASDLNVAMFQVAMMGVILAPVCLPQVVRRLTGLDPDHPNFQTAYTEQVKLLMRRLSG